MEVHKGNKIIVNIGLDAGVYYCTYRQETDPGPDVKAVVAASCPLLVYQILGSMTYKLLFMVVGEEHL